MRGNRRQRPHLPVEDRADRSSPPDDRQVLVVRLDRRERHLLGGLDRDDRNDRAGRSDIDRGPLGRLGPGCLDDRSRRFGVSRFGNGGTHRSSDGRPARIWIHRDDAGDASLPCDTDDTEADRPQSDHGERVTHSGPLECCKSRRQVVCEEDCRGVLDITGGNERGRGERHPHQFGLTSVESDRRIDA